MNQRSTRRSLARRLSPLALVAIGLLAYFGNMAVASATAPIGNTDPSCQSYDGFSNWGLFVNGKQVNTTADSSLAGKVKPGDKVSFLFVLKAKCDGLYVGIDSYKATAATFNNNQTLFQRSAHTYPADGKNHTIEVTVPDCYFQVDVYTGSTFKVGDYTNSGGIGFITSDNGGTKSCVPATTTTGKPRPIVTTTTAKPTTTTAKPKPTTTTTVKVTTTTGKPRPIVTTTTMKPTTTTTMKPTTTTTVKPTTTTTVKPTTTTTVKPTTTTIPVVVKNSATIAKECKVGGSGWDVTYTNSGSTSQTFVLSGAGKTIDTVTVAAGKNTTKSYTYADNNVAAGKSLDLKVVVGSTQLATQTVTNDCYQVTADVVAQCNTTAGIGAVFTLNNTGKLDEVFTISSGGKAIDISPVTVKAGSTTTIASKISDHAVTAFEIKSANTGLDVKKSVATDCIQVLGTVITTPPTTVAPTTTTVKPVVLAETITKPALAFTGFTVTPLIFGGAGLIILGGAFLLGARRNAKLVSRS